MPRPSRAATRAIYAADRASDGELFDDAPVAPVKVYSIATKNAVFGIEVRDDVVVKAAPIAAWSVGKPIRGVLDYYNTRNARIVEVDAAPAVRNHKRPCAVCGVSSLYAGRLCDSCRHNAAQLLVEHQTIAMAHHDRLDAAWDAYETAVAHVTPAEFEAFGRMILAWEACRALPTNDARVVAFRGKYSAARKHGGAFGTLVRAWHDWRMLTPQHEALKGIEEKIGVLKDAILLQEASRLGWETEGAQA